MEGTAAKLFIKKADLEEKRCKECSIFSCVKDMLITLL